MHAFRAPDEVAGRRFWRAFRFQRLFAGRAALLLAIVALTAPALRAEYVVLRNGLRLRVTGYQLVGDKYLLQMTGGKLEIAAAEVVTIEPEDTFGPPATVQTDPQPLYRDLVEAAAKRYNMDADLITSVIAVESNFDPKAVSRKNAHGLMQLLPETASQLGVKNIDDPAENIDGGTRYLSYLLQMYNNNLSLALAAYNAGPLKVQLYGNVPPYAETISYVRRVKRGYEKNKTETSKKASTTQKNAANGLASAVASVPVASVPVANAPAQKTPALPAAGAGTVPSPKTPVANAPAKPGSGIMPGTSAATSRPGADPLAPGAGFLPEPSPRKSAAGTPPTSSPPRTSQPQ